MKERATAWNREICPPLVAYIPELTLKYGMLNLKDKDVNPISVILAI